MTLHIADGLDLPDELVTQPCAILARRGAGKTYTASVMTEELLEHGLPTVVLDPIGVWWGLRASADGKSAGLRPAARPLAEGRVMPPQHRTTDLLDRIEHLLASATERQPAELKDRTWSHDWIARHLSEDPGRVYRALSQWGYRMQFRKERTPSGYVLWGLRDIEVSAVIDDMVSHELVDDVERWLTGQEATA